MTEQGTGWRQRHRKGHDTSQRRLIVIKIKRKRGTRIMRSKIEFKKPKPAGFVIEAGNWCKKYEDFIIDHVVKKCKKENNMHPKGCTYCIHYSYKVISKEI